MSDRKRKVSRIGWAWFGATIGGYVGERVAELLPVNETVVLFAFSVDTGIFGFVAGAFLGVILSEALTSPSVASGLKGIVLGTKHALAASIGGITGLLLVRNVAFASITAFPELTVSGLGAAVGVLCAELLF
jgi:hypothetical protein